MRGHVYVLLNPAFKKLLKIGMTVRTPEERAIELSQSTGVPNNFVVAYSVEVSDCITGEKLIHSRLSDCRYSKEFFEVDLKKVIDLLINLEKELPVVDEEVIEEDTETINIETENYVDEKEPNDKVSLDSYYSKIYFRNGLMLFKKKNYERAILYFENAIKYNNIFSDAYYYRGWCNFELGKYDNAISDLEFVRKSLNSYQNEAEALIKESLKRKETTVHFTDLFKDYFKD